MLAADLSVIAPELVLAIFACAALMWGVYARSPTPAARILWGACALFVLCGLWIGFQPEGTRLAFGGSFVSDGFARFAKVLILFGAAATLALSQEYLDRTELMKFEYPVLITLSAAGMMTMVSAMDLIVLYMGLELQSLSLYVVAAFRRDSLRSTEAGLKYFVLGALSSGLLLYGASLTYGFAGTTAFAGIAEVVAARPAVARADLRAGVPLPPAWRSRSPPPPSTCGRPTSTRARRRPVTAFFATAPKVAAAGDVRPRALRRLRRRGRRLAADPRPARGRLDVPRRGRRHRPAQLQAADGLFLDRPHGLRADGAGRRHRRGRAGAADLPRDLRDDERRRLRLHPEHAARRQADRRPLRARPLLPGRAGARRRARGAALQPGGRAAARRLLREVLRAEGGGRRRAASGWRSRASSPA